MREVERDKKLRRREYIFIYKILDTLLSYKESSRASPVSGWPIVRTTVLTVLAMLAVAGVLSAPPAAAAPL